MAEGRKKGKGTKSLWGPHREKKQFGKEGRKRGEVLQVIVLGEKCERRGVSGH